MIASARRHFAEHGYLAASLDRIADDAGYTRGAVYANFDGKPALLFAVLDERLDQQVDELDPIRGDATAVAAWREMNATREEGLAQAVQEFRVVALRDPLLRPQLRDRERTVRNAFAGLIERAADDAGTTLPLPATDLASVVLALGEGITQQHQLDPDEVDMELVGVVLAMLVPAFGERDGSGDR